MNETYAAFSSSFSSSFDPDAVFVGCSSGTIFDPLLLLPSNVVSAKRLFTVIFSIILPPAVKSDILCLRAALCLAALTRSACESEMKTT